MLLTKHEGVTFKDQTIYLSGQGFVRCHFVGCTLVLRETVKYVEQCTFERCNWHIDLVLLWGSPESLQDLKGLIALIEMGQQQQIPPEMRQHAQAVPAPMAPLDIPPLTGAGMSNSE